MGTYTESMFAPNATLSLVYRLHIQSIYAALSALVPDGISLKLHSKLNSLSLFVDRDDFHFYLLV
jgi:hypothetical protein